MMPDSEPMDGAQGTSPAYQARDLLNRLQFDLEQHDAKRGMETEEQATNRIQGISQALGSLCNEHSGMVDELLGVYEQLGVIFEVTKTLPGVDSEFEVLRVFVENLRQSFPQCDVAVFRPGPDGLVKVLGQDLAPIPQMEEQINACNEERAAIVRTVQNEHYAECLTSPVLSGSDFLGTIVMARLKDSPEFRASDMSLVESLGSFCGDLIRNHRLMAEVQNLLSNLVHSLVNAIDQKDEYTAGHSTRVAYFADILAREIGISEEDHRMLNWSALLHDVGKIGIRDNVLKKQGPLTDDEFAHMKEHPVRSFDVVKAVPQLTGALDGVRFHHERYDGKGYPLGLKGEEIPLQARIIQIADIFDALTSTRSYRAAFEWQKALSIMEEEAGTTIDPKLQKVFDRLIRQKLESLNHDWSELSRIAGGFLAGWNGTQGQAHPAEESQSRNGTHGLQAKVGSQHAADPNDKGPAS